MEEALKPHAKEDVDSRFWPGVLSTSSPGRHPCPPSCPGQHPQEASLASSYQFPDPVQDQVNDLLADGVMASGVIIGCVLLPGDQLLWVEELPVGPRAHFICKEDTWAVGLQGLLLTRQGG